MINGINKNKKKKMNTNINHIRSCAFSVNDGWTRLIVFFLLDPHLFKSRQRRQDGTSNPDRVLSLWWSNNLNRHRVWCQCLNLCLHTFWNLYMVVPPDITMLPYKSFRISTSHFI